MTPQDIINKVYNHFVTEGNPRSFIEDGNNGLSCQYRSPDGNKCAVGILISDKRYRKDMEGRTLVGLLGSHRDRLPQYMQDNSLLLQRLQSWHDDHSKRTLYLNSRENVRAIKRIAKAYDCTVPE